MGNHRRRHRLLQFIQQIRWDDSSPSSSTVTATTAVIAVSAITQRLLAWFMIDHDSIIIKTFCILSGEGDASSSSLVPDDWWWHYFTLSCPALPSSRVAAVTLLVAKRSTANRTLAVHAILLFLRRLVAFGSGNELHNRVHNTWCTWIYDVSINNYYNSELSHTRILNNIFSN